ncbi:MAG: tetratricopeptide repeat protein, partial [Planctomycetes bacterium]|nr:tetratricopeptide repeat protein [Planctomycetota bacterium]
LQAVVGYDSLRRTLILRDPGERHRVEIGFDLMRERYRSTGPRGMAMVPEAQKDQLAGLTLPDETLYDHLHHMELALQEHRRDDAGAAVQAMTAQNAGHFLTVSARRILAHYDADLPEELIQTDRMLELFPGDLHFELARANILSILGRYHERVGILKRVAEQKDSDPACWQQYAWELSIDAREHPRALYLLRRAARANPMLARTYSTLARIKSMQRDFDAALELYHFAVCLEEKDEFVAQDYFLEARAQGKTEEAMEFLQRRCDRLGASSSQPARTLYFALMQQGRYDDAFNVLERAMRLRPDDGELLTYSAEAHMYLGNFARAEELLDKANGVSKPAARWRSLAYLAANQGDSVLARERWAEVLKIEPIAEDAHRNYCLLLGEKEGREAAIRHLETVCQRFPYHFGLTRMLYDWMLEDGPAAREKVLTRLIDIHPADAWTRREYAINLGEQGRLDDAFQQLFEAEPLEPNAASLWHSREYVAKKAKKVEDAQFAYREAIRSYVDYEPAIFDLIQQCANLQERRDAVAFVEQELIRQGTFGNGILALRDAALTLMPPLELLMSLRRVFDLRPDLWQSWSAVVRQLVCLERFDDGLDMAQRAVQRFPLYAAGWFDLAEARRFCKILDGEIAALKRCVELSPTWDVARKWLVDAYERAGDLAQAKAAVVHAIQRAPLAGATYNDHAELLWRNNEHDEAIKQVRHALKLDPGLEAAWNNLVGWCNQLDRYNEVFEVARGLTSQRRGEARSWLRLAHAYHWQPPRTNAEDEAKRIDDCVAAYDEALMRNPSAINIHDLKAQALVVGGRFDDAAKACNPAFYRGKPPIELRGRSAWIKTQEGDFDAARKQMVPLLKEDPTYTWGWNELVNWCMASGQFKEYYDAANEMLRQMPHSAMALTYRGEAQMRMDDRAIGLDDLRAAFRKDPCNTLTAFLLFDEQMADEDYSGADATMTVMQQSIAGDFVKARQIQLAGKKDGKELALEKFKHLVLSRNPSTWPLDVSARALDLAGWKPDAETIVLDAIEKPNWDTHLAFIYATWWNPNVANDLPDRIGVIDRALERLPGNFRFLDLKAELLANGCQFERAWQTCKEKTYPAEQYFLDGRAAWVMFRSGRIMEAIFEMRKLLKQYPKYYWGWMQLADWYGRQAQWVDVLTVAEQMVLLNPRDPLGFGYRGQAKENLNDPQAARADYLYSVDLQPAFIFGAWQLFKMYVRAGEWQRAEKILEKTKKFADPGEWALRKVDMVVYQNKKGAFAAEFENLCRTSTKMPLLLHHSLQFIVQAGWWSDAEAVLHRCLDLGAHICDFWVQYRVAMGDRRVGEDIENMAMTRPERTNCIAAYAVELGYMLDTTGLRRWVVDHEDALRADAACWAKAGFAFSVAQDWPGVIEWMADWREQAQATPGHLLPLVRAHRALGETEEARRVGGHALTKLTPDYAASFHKVWLMFDQALEGDSLTVQRYLETADLGGFDGYHQMISSMVRSLWMTQTDKENGFAHARQLLADTAQYALPPILDPALTQAYQLCVAELARLRGTFWAKLWRWWRWLFPTMPQPPQPPQQ